MRRVGSVQRGLRFIWKGKLTPLNAWIGVGQKHAHWLCQPRHATNLPRGVEPSPSSKAGAGELRFRSRNDTKELLAPTTPKQITPV